MGKHSQILISPRSEVPKIPLKENIFLSLSTNLKFGTLDNTLPLVNPAPNRPLPQVFSHSTPWEFPSYKWRNKPPFPNTLINDKSRHLEILWWGDDITHPKGAYDFKDMLTRLNPMAKENFPGGGSLQEAKNQFRNQYKPLIHHNNKIKSNPLL
jgi:hypothetical protein